MSEIIKMEDNKKYLVRHKDSTYVDYKSELIKLRLELRNLFDALAEEDSEGIDKEIRFLFNDLRKREKIVYEQLVILMKWYKNESKQLWLDMNTQDGLFMPEKKRKTKKSWFSKFICKRFGLFTLVDIYKIQAKHGIYIRKQSDKIKKLIDILPIYIYP